MKTRLSKLTDSQLYTIAKRVRDCVDRLMSDPADGYQPFGWDWPTFRAIHTRKWNVLHAICEEAKRRGLA